MILQYHLTWTQRWENQCFPFEFKNVYVDGTTYTDALGFGTHFYMPELTSTAQVSRDNATTKETQVQPRDLHVPHLPVLGVINVSNIDAVFTDYIGGVPTRS